MVMVQERGGWGWLFSSGVGVVEGLGGLGEGLIFYVHRISIFLIRFATVGARGVLPISGLTAGHASQRARIVSLCLPFTVQQRRQRRSRMSASKSSKVCRGS